VGTGAADCAGTGAEVDGGGAVATDELGDGTVALGTAADAAWLPARWWRRWWARRV
jgi:hypothetical protein